jgi:hypothetical protein
MHTLGIKTGAAMVMGTIAYNRFDMRRIQATYGRDAVTGIFAHELGHACDVSRRRAPTEESADMQAGCVLAILGAKQEPMNLFLMAESIPDKDHPTAVQRIKLIEAGYSACLGIWRHANIGSIR